MELNFLVEDYLLMPWILSINVIYKGGLLEISVGDLAFYLKELNSVFGPELNFMINSYQNMDGNIIMMP